MNDGTRRRQRDDDDGDEDDDDDGGCDDKDDSNQDDNVTSLSTGKRHVEYCKNKTKAKHNKTKHAAMASTSSSTSGVVSYHRVVVL